MEALNNIQTQINSPERTRKSFIEANTISSSLGQIKATHIIPVFAKDCEPVISQSDFIDAAWDSLHNYYQGEVISQPEVRISHPVQGIIASARNKPIQYLEE